MSMSLIDNQHRWYQNQTLNDPGRMELLPPVSGDMSAALQKAVDELDTVVLNAGSTYRVDSPITITTPTKIVGAGMESSVIDARLPSTGGKLFDIRSSDVEFADLKITGANHSFDLDSNFYCLFFGDGSTKYMTAAVRRVKIENWINSTDYTELWDATPVASHGIYISNYDKVTIEDCRLIDTYGAGLFVKDCAWLTVQRNRFQNQRWYPVNLEENVSHYTITECVFAQDFTEGVYWGGMLNVASQTGSQRCGYGTISKNEFFGKVGYGAVVRLQSAYETTVTENRIYDISLGTQLSATPSTLTGIRVTTRGTADATQNGPCRAITISNNTLEAPTDDATNTEWMVGIYVDNPWFQTTARQPIMDLNILNNTIHNPGSASTKWWDAAIILHGQYGGIERFKVNDNFCQSQRNNTAPLNGSIGMDAFNAQGIVEYGERLRNIALVESGTALYLGTQTANITTS